MAPPNQPLQTDLRFVSLRLLNGNPVRLKAWKTPSGQ